ncbi:MAG: hypothetical protein GY861_12120 [bacterium]|nr:hypothetical protein [bacterium]
MTNDTLAGKTYQTSTDLASLVTTIGSTNVTLVISKSITLTTNLTIPSNITLDFIGLGVINQGAYSLTINGYVNITHGSQAFSGAGNLYLNKNRKLDVNWFGADRTGATLSTTAIQKAIDTLENTVSGGATGGGIVYLPGGRYLSGSLLISKQFVSLQGDGPTATEILSSGTLTYLVKLTLSTAPNVIVNAYSRFEGIKFQYFQKINI